MTKFLAIDYGLERTGLAISDPEEKLAFPLATLKLTEFGSRSNLLDALVSLARRNGAQALVLGLPLHVDGSENLMVRQVRNIAKRLRRRLPLPLYWMSEILSSSEARNDLLATGLRDEKLEAALDQQAACRILESFLAQPRQERISG